MKLKMEEKYEMYFVAVGCCCVDVIQFFQNVSIAGIAVMMMSFMFQSSRHFVNMWAPWSSVGCVLAQFLFLEQISGYSFLYIKW